MVVCKYFLQGNCRHGSKCRNEHTMTNEESGRSVMRPRTSASGSASTMDVNTLVKSVQTDMTNCEKCGQWLLSSYTPFKEKPAFPGFTDQSFEEVRLGFYEANANGTIEQFKQQYQEMLQTAMHKIRVLQAPNEQVAQMLLQIYNTPVASASTPATQAPFGTTPFATTSSPFGQVNAQQSPFGQQQQQQAQSPFGGVAAMNSPLAQAANPPAAANYPFGQGPFGNNQTTFLSSMKLDAFNAPAQQMANQARPFASGGNIFAQPTAAPSTPLPQGSIFARAAQNYQPQVTQPPPQTAPAPTNVFAQAAQNYTAKTATAPASVFPQSPQANTKIASNSPFGTQQTTGNIFAQGQSQNTATTRSIFGGKPATTGKSHCYSSSDVITMLAPLFQGEKFASNRIPFKPPSVEFCQ